MAAGRHKATLLGRAGCCHFVLRVKFDSQIAVQLLERGQAEMKKESFSHLDASGNARMVDVGAKPITRRTAQAEAIVQMSSSLAERLRSGPMPKGDVLQVARIAAIAGAKRTDELIPLCHSLPLDQVTADFHWDGPSRLRVQVQAIATARTGVEMEALVGASLAALTIYDMCKALDKSISIEHVQLVSKTGGASGDYQRVAERDHGGRDHGTGG